MITLYVCDTCKHELGLYISPRIPGSMDPEKNQPPSGGDVDPDECPRCHTAVDAERARWEAGIV